MSALNELLVPAAQAEELRRAALSFPSHTLSRRQLCDLELLINGGYAPLRGFMDQASYESVLERARLPDGRLWPIPVVLGVSARFAATLREGDRIALRDREGFMPAVLKLTQIWRPDIEREAEAVYGTGSPEHPGVAYLQQQGGEYYLGGLVEGLQLPIHYDFESLWDTPRELRDRFRKLGWRRILGFHCSAPLHRLQRELILGVAKAEQCHILLHPAVGDARPGDPRYYARVHAYQAVGRRFPHELATLALLPLASRRAGPREALWHAILQQNYGCTHLILGPDHASPSPAANGRPWYGKYAAQAYVAGFAAELDIRPVPVAELRYVPSLGQFRSDAEIEGEGLDSEGLSEEDLQELLARGQELPAWCSWPEVIEPLRRAYPPRSRQGITLFFTGLSGSGKSTLANILFAKLSEAGGRPVSLLDGDLVRRHLSSELGFSKEHRDLNIRRLGFVASEISKNGGVAICAPIAPYRETRRAVRALIERHGDRKSVV
jgi:sulfate adenylyltransferase